MGVRFSDNYQLEETPETNQIKRTEDKIHQLEETPEIITSQYTNKLTKIRFQMLDFKKKKKNKICKIQSRDRTNP